MAASSRRQQIERLLADDPKDSFLRYGLAMEYGAEGSDQRLVELLQGLLKDSPEYVPAYFHCAQGLLRLGRSEEAKGTLETGISQARRAGDAHAAEEMQGLLMTLE
jgi:thioredoxin-like negative regulator of GroEL